MEGYRKMIGRLLLAKAGGSAAEPLLPLIERIAGLSVLESLLESVEHASTLAEAERALRKAARPRRTRK